MEIPFSYYISFWVKGSLLALATGFLLTIFIPPLFVTFPYFGFIGVFIYQVFIYRYFRGARRGDFEYKYKESIIDKTLNSYIFKSFGFIKYFKFKMDDFSQIRSAQLEILKEIPIGSNEKRIKIAAYLKIAEVYSTDDDIIQEELALKRAIEIEKHNIISNIRIAVFYERSGKGDEAIKHYQAALSDTEIYSEQIQIYLREQIKRVKTSGPSKRPPMPGLRYISW